MDEVHTLFWDKFARRGAAEWEGVEATQHSPNGLLIRRKSGSGHPDEVSVFFNPRVVAELQAADAPRQAEILERAAGTLSFRLTEHALTGQPAGYCHVKIGPEALDPL
jgi:hypothetical protein